MTDEAFEGYVAQFVLPSLRPGVILVWDNLGAHKIKRVRELVESVGASVVFLPSSNATNIPCDRARRSR
jgi:transposase